ncbi:uncharacterized protein LOC108673874 [Hyalella azteca]|uniref:Uncharacterized protein LOC108673874 n=1 Tax=Hyalella azteca TaxID=294128 RepID=A0A8B7NU48_HYAAZ|nr:uncharacterized protein LOC108673874 [Hyalella azteca]
MVVTDERPKMVVTDERLRLPYPQTRWSQPAFNNGLAMARLAGRGLHAHKGSFHTPSRTGTPRTGTKENLFLKTLELAKKGVSKGAALLKGALIKGKVLAKAKANLMNIKSKVIKNYVKPRTLPTSSRHLVPSRAGQVYPPLHFGPKLVVPSAVRGRWTRG